MLTITCYYLSFLLTIPVEVTWHFTVVFLKCVLLTYSWFIVAVQLPRHVPLFATPWTAARQASLSLTTSWSLPKFMFIASVMWSSHLIPSHPLLLCPQSFPVSRTFPMSCLFSSDDQNTGASASASVLPVNIQGWSPLRLTGWSPCSPKDVQGSSPAPQFKVDL